MCLLTKQCNDIDTASLLIALLRTSGIPARYVLGTIEVPIDQVMNWVGGFTDEDSALGFIASGGTPVTGLISGGQIVAARLEHVWVEAHLDYIPSRGAVHKEGDTWIPMDASFKQFSFTEGVDLKTAVPFDAQAFLDNIKSTATFDEQESFLTNIDTAFIESTQEDIQTQLFDNIQQTVPNPTVGDLTGKREIKAQVFPFLPATLPFQIVILGGRLSTLTDNFRHRITIQVYPDLFLSPSFSVAVSLPEISGKSLSFSYIPASPEDQTTIEAFGGIDRVPPYLVEMQPILKLETVVLAIGGAETLGRTQTIRTSFFEPLEGLVDKIDKQAVVGSSYSIIVDLHRIPGQLLQSRIDNLNTLLAEQPVDQDELESEVLFITGLAYFFMTDTFSETQAKDFDIVWTRRPSEAFTAKALAVSLLFGVPSEVKFAGLGIDVKRDIVAPASLAGKADTVRTWVINSGIFGSAEEHGIFEQLFGVSGISTIQVLRIANESGIPIFSIDSSNVSAILPQLQLSQNVKNDITNAINAGKIAVVPQQNITFFEWTGAGYIIADPDTGSASYLISGQVVTAGGGSVIVVPVTNEVAQQVADNGIILIDAANDLIIPGTELVLGGLGIIYAAQAITALDVAGVVAVGVGLAGGGLLWVTLGFLIFFAVPKTAGG